jgi:hypothetical protein
MPITWDMVPEGPNAWDGGQGLRFRDGAAGRHAGGLGLRPRRPDLQVAGLATGALSGAQGRQRRKLAIRRKPVAWLFSGWNCVPMTLPRPITAVTGSP